MFVEQTVPTAFILVTWKKFEAEHCFFLFVHFPATNKSSSERRFASRRKKITQKFSEKQQNKFVFHASNDFHSYFCDFQYQIL